MLGKKTAALLLTLILGGLCLALALLPPLRQSVAYSLAEDFRLRESLGRVFFLREEGASTEVFSPAELNTAEAGETAGEPCLRLLVQKNEAIYAREGGTLESAVNGRVTLRSEDGSKTVYDGVGALVRTGETLRAGDVIGYALSENVRCRKYVRGAAVTWPQ